MQSNYKRGIFENPKKSPFSIEKYDDGWEKEYMEQLEADSEVIKWTKNHNIKIPYVDDAGYKKHFEPDFLVEKADGKKEIHEVKGGHLMNRETQLKMNAAKLFTQSRNMVFRLITKQ